MWDHVKEAHGGEVGEDKGRDDFELVLTGRDKCVQRRVVRESVKIERIMTGEDRRYEAEMKEAWEEEKKEAEKKWILRRRKQLRVRNTNEDENVDDREEVDEELTAEAERGRKVKMVKNRSRVVLLNSHLEWFTPKLVGVTVTQL